MSHVRLPTDSPRVHHILLMTFFLFPNNTSSHWKTDIPPQSRKKRTLSLNEKFGVFWYMPNSIHTSMQLVHTAIKCFSWTEELSCCTHPQLTTSDSEWVTSKKMNTLNFLPMVYQLNSVGTTQKDCSFGCFTQIGTCLYTFTENASGSHTKLYRKL